MSSDINRCFLLVHSHGVLCQSISHMVRIWSQTMEILYIGFYFICSAMGNTTAFFSRFITLHYWQHHLKRNPETEGVVLLSADLCHQTAKHGVNFNGKVLLFVVSGGTKPPRCRVFLSLILNMTSNCFLYLIQYSYFFPISSSFMAGSVL